MVPENTNALDSYVNRIRSEEKYHRSKQLWDLLENIGYSEMEDLLNALEDSVSWGFFGLAAELTDRIESFGKRYLKHRPASGIRVQVERMRRNAYMGFPKATISASNCVIGQVESNRYALAPDLYLLWGFSANSFCGWMTDDLVKLCNVYTNCSNIVDKLPASNLIKNECLGFLDGLQGRMGFLNENYQNGKDGFERAIERVNDSKLWGSSCYLHIYYAEHLANEQQWEEAIKIADSFLRIALSTRIKNHLVLRAVILYLNAPESVVNAAKKREMAFKCRILIFALGLSQSIDVYPRLGRIRDNVQKLTHSTTDLFDTDKIDDTYNWFRSLGWEQMESVLRLYYEGMNYHVKSLPQNTPALDLIATTKVPDGSDHKLGIQVKHWSNTVRKGDIPDETVFGEASIVIGGSLDRLLWYCSSGIDHHALKLLRERAKVFGTGCKVSVLDLQSLINELLTLPNVLTHILFSVNMQESNGAE